MKNEDLNLVSSNVVNADYINHYLKDERNYVQKIIQTNISKYRPCKIPNIITNDYCDFIINESEKFASRNISPDNSLGWTTTRHRNYPTTDLPVSKIPMLKTFVFNLIHKNVFPEFKKHFELNDLFLDMNDVFVVKYDANNQNKLKKHRDGSAFSFNILLSDPKNFQGGGTKFYYKEENEENEEIIMNEKGSLIIHSGFIEHEGIEITKGQRYILVGFITYLKNEYSSINSQESLSKVSNINKMQKVNNIIINKQQVNLIDNYFLTMEEKNESKLHHFMSTFSANTFLLNKTQDKFNIIENIVYDLFLFHIKKVNKIDEIDNFEIEYWIKHSNLIPKKYLLHNSHSDKDEVIKKKTGLYLHPFLSTITYLHTSNTITLISNMNEKDRNEKNLVLNNGINLSFTRKNKHITFNGENIHNVLNLDMDNNHNKKRYAIMFNIWYKHKPLEIKYFDNKNIHNDFLYDNNDNDNNKCVLKITENVDHVNHTINYYKMYKLVKYFHLNKINKLVEKIKEEIKLIKDYDDSEENNKNLILFNLE